MAAGVYVQIIIWILKKNKQKKTLLCFLFFFGFFFLGLNGSLLLYGFICNQHFFWLNWICVDQK